LFPELAVRGEFLGQVGDLDLELFFSEELFQLLEGEQLSESVVKVG
jgi:hypothetical protein